MINPQPYQIQALNYHDREVKKDKVYEFKKRIWIWIKANDPEMKENPLWMLKEFITYWTAKNDNGRKMYFEMQKKWNTGLRLATWRKNAQKDKRWKEPQTVTIKQPDLDSYGDIDYDAYKKRMESRPQHKGGNIGSILRKQFNANQ